MKLSCLLDGIEEEMGVQLLQGSYDVEIKNVQNNSKAVKDGDVFFCITGARFDGHKYIDEVCAAGATVVVCERIPEVKAPDNVTVLLVNSTRYAMGAMTSKFYGEPSKKLTVIGLTGTKGKTTTTYMIQAMLNASGHKCGLVGTIEIDNGNEKIPAKNTTPESIVLHKYLQDMVNNGVDSVVMEVSSQGLMLDRVAGVDFDYGIFTNLSKDHIGPNEHASFEEYRDWKAKLFTLCKIGIFNVDDSHAKYMMEKATCDVVTYGMKGEETGTRNIDYKASSYELYTENGVLGSNYDLCGKLTGAIKLGLPGEFSVHNSLSAIAVADLMGVPFEEIKKILIDIKVRGRVEMIPISDAFTVLIDYAHNAMALESLLTALRAYNPKRLVTLFGCGGDRSRDRRFEMGEVSGNMSDFTIITSDNPRTEEPQAILDDIKTGINRTSGKHVDIIDRKEAMRYAIMNAKEGDVIVFAGKGHEDYQEIHGVKYHMDERELIQEILEEEDVTKICGYNNRYFA